METVALYPFGTLIRDCNQSRIISIHDI